MARPRTQAPGLPLASLRARLTERGLVAMRESGAVVVLSLGILTTLSLLSYAPSDSSLNQAPGQAGAAVQNWIGPVGALWADLCLQVMGLSAWLFDAALLICGSRLMLGRRGQLTRRQFFATFGLLTSVGTLIELLAVGNRSSYPLGGVLGALSARTLRELFAPVGAATLAATGAVLSLTVCLGGVLSSLAWRLQAQLDAARGQARSRTHRALREARARVAPAQLRTLWTTRDARAWLAAGAVAARAAEAAEAEAAARPPRPAPTLAGAAPAGGGGAQAEVAFAPAAGQAAGTAPAVVAPEHAAAPPAPGRSALESDPAGLSDRMLHVTQATPAAAPVEPSIAVAAAAQAPDVSRDATDLGGPTDVRASSQQTAPPPAARAIKPAVAVAPQPTPVDLSVPADAPSGPSAGWGPSDMAATLAQEALAEAEAEAAAATAVGAAAAGLAGALATAPAGKSVAPQADFERPAVSEATPAAEAAGAFDVTGVDLEHTGEPRWASAMDACPAVDGVEAMPIGEAGAEPLDVTARPVPAAAEPAPSADAPLAVANDPVAAYEVAGPHGEVDLEAAESELAGLNAWDAVEEELAAEPGDLARADQAAGVVDVHAATPSMAAAHKGTPAAEQADHLDADHVAGNDDVDAPRGDAEPASAEAGDHGPHEARAAQMARDFVAACAQADGAMAHASADAEAPQDPSAEHEPAFAAQLPEPEAHAPGGERRPPKQRAAGATDADDDELAALYAVDRDEFGQLDEADREELRLLAAREREANETNDVDGADDVVEHDELAEAGLTPGGTNNELVLQAPRRLAPRLYALPPLELLHFEPEARTPIDPELLQQNAARLTKTLGDYGIEGHVREIRPGPVVTMYEYVPGPGIKLAKIASLADDLAMSMQAFRVRIVAPIPGKGAVGIEIPNDNRELVHFKEIVSEVSFRDAPSPLTMALGKDIEGSACTADLARMPHLLVAGATGAGKSVSVNAMIMSVLFKSTPDEVRMIMVDPKMLELSVYEGIPHLLLPVVTDPRKAAVALRWAVQEMERRYELLSEVGVRSIEGYNARVRAGEAKGEPLTVAGTDVQSARKACDPLPYLLVIVDELADLMMVAPREVEGSIMRLAQMARAAGIHLILATQRPSVDVLTGVIKANFPTRIAFQVASRHDSRTIIDANGAEHLLGRGDMLYMASTAGGIKRVHGAYVSEEDIERTVQFVREQAGPTYDETILLEQAEEEESGAADDGEQDEMYDQAVAIVAETQQASISMIQRRLRIGYNRAARMVDSMESAGIVGPGDGAKPREVFVQQPSA